MTGVLHGRLGPATDAPADGERFDEVVSTAAFRIEHILSGQVDTPAEHLATTDEWVLVLDGAATLEVYDERVEVRTGDWLFIPANLPHRLLRVEPGTRWLAVHGAVAH